MLYLLLILLLLLCAGLTGTLLSLRRGLRRAKEQLAAQLHDETVSRLNVPCPGRATEELFAAVNDLLELRQEERAAYRRKEEALRRQIADVSHDLRTPLTSILGYLQLLEDERLTPEQRAEYLEIIRGRAAVLQTLITSFYDLSRVEGGQWVLVPEATDLGRIVGDQLAASYEAFENAGITVSAELPEGLPPVWCDRRAAERIVSNLLTNALTHGRESFSVRLSLEDGAVVSRFTNGAPGLTEEDARRVFERFYVADRARTGQGSGLGLAIVKALAERMGCAVSAGAEAGEFTVCVVWRRT